MADEPEIDRGSGGSESEEPVPTVVFPFDVSYPFAHAGRLFGVQPDRARLELAGDELTAIFGPWCVRTGLANVVSVEVTGPYNILKVVGPAHLSLADGGLTFATNTESGVCITFREPVRGLLPTSLVRHGSLTVTVADPDAVQASLEKSLRAMREAADEESAREAVEQSERDAIQGSTTAELRHRADAMGIENSAEMSHAQLVEAMKTGIVEAGEHQSSD